MREGARGEKPVRPQTAANIHVRWRFESTTFMEFPGLTEAKSRQQQLLKLLPSAKPVVSFFPTVTSQGFALHTDHGGSQSLLSTQTIDLEIAFGSIDPPVEFVAIEGGEFKAPRKVFCHWFHGLRCGMVGIPLLTQGPSRGCFMRA